MKSILGWVWVVVIVIGAIALLLWPEFPWLPLTTNAEQLRQATPPALGQADMANQMYQLASVASYCAVITLAVLSFSVPLLLLYYNQIVDGFQSALLAVFEEMRLEDKKTEKYQKLREIYHDARVDLGEAQTRGQAIKPGFYTVVGLAIGLLFFLLVTHLLPIGHAIGFFSLVVRSFNISIWLGMNSVGVMVALARGKYASKRILLLERLAVQIDPADGEV